MITVSLGTEGEEVKKMSGIELIQEERQKQIDAEGWTPEHDDTHSAYEMTAAAASYLAFVYRRFSQGCSTDFSRQKGMLWWPWDAAWFKTPEDPIRNLVKAGALIAAEIDRLQQKAEGK